jgi:hypothetical protein
LGCEKFRQNAKNQILNAIFYPNIPVQPNLATDEIWELRILGIPFLFLGTCCRNLAN